MDREGLLNMVGSSWDRLVELWTVFGHGPEALDRRRRTVHKHTEDLLTDMVNEEEAKISEKRLEITKLKDTIVDLKTKLQEPELDHDESLSLLQQEVELGFVLQQVRARYEAKMKRWNELKEEEARLRALISEDHEVDIVNMAEGVPTNEEVSSLTESVNNLQAVLQTRTSTYTEVKSDVKDLMEELDFIPNSAIQRAILAPNPPVPLSRDFLREACELLLDLQRQKDEVMREVTEKKEKIEALWNRLEIPYEDRVLDFNNLKPSGLTLIRSELLRLEALKQANIGKFIGKLKIEIEAMAVQIYKHTPIMSFECTEEALLEHEELLQSLKDYFNINEKILGLYKAWLEKWSEWVRYDEMASDPSRFNNRGGGLLKEEKTRKGLEKALPSIEKQIQSIVNAGGGIFIFGAEVMDVIHGKREEFRKGKEEERDRKKAQEKPINMNVTRKRTAAAASGIATPSMSQPQTPGKRTRLLTPHNKRETPLVPSSACPMTPRKLDPIPSPTYSEFTSHQMFQSTMTETKVLQTPSMKTPTKTPSRKTPTKSPTRTAPKLTPAVKNLAFNKF